MRPKYVIKSSQINEAVVFISKNMSSHNQIEIIIAVTHPHLKITLK